MTPDFLSVCRLDVTPLAPIHIGSGEDMDPTSYVLDADALYEFPPAALSAVLDEADRKRLLRLVDDMQDERTLIGVRKFLFERRNGLVAHASRAVRAAPGVQELYEARLGAVAQKETKEVNRLGIERIFSHPGTRAPILPGSSLKGAIRTALLNRENGGQGFGDQRKRSPELQKRLFDYHGFESDPMRLVHIADAMSSGCPAMDEIASDTAIVFAVNRKKRNLAGKDGREIRSQAEQKGLYQTLEIVPAFRWRAFRGGCVIHRADLPDDRRLPKHRLRWTAAEIANACNQFHRGHFLRETEALHERGLLDERWHATVQRLMANGLGELLDSNRAFLLRIGRHSGAESVTLDGVRSIRIMTPQGQPKREEDEATTWWLASEHVDASSGLLPFGWVLVEMTEGDATPAPRPQIAEVLDSFHAESGEREWRAEVMQRRAALRQEQEVEATRRIDAERRRREQEAGEREREEKRAAMTDEEKVLDDLRRGLEAISKDRTVARGQGGELPGRAVQILDAARTWPEATRLEAADLVEQVFRTIGFPKGRKGRQRKQQISSLREGSE